MYSNNKLQIGLFGANCSSGRAVTLVPERWTGSWPDNLRLGKMADDGGLDFLLPIARWKGYGGDTDYQGATFETVTWACGRSLRKSEPVIPGAALSLPRKRGREIGTRDGIKLRRPLKTTILKAPPPRPAGARCLPGATDGGRRP